MKGKQAIVVGASMSGLLAARALSNHFERVLVVERDALLKESHHRKGIPQDKHPHVLLAAGARALEQLFPGLRNQMVAAGGIPGTPTQHTRWYQFGGYKKEFESDVEAILLSRPLLESIVRERVRGLPNVSFLDSCSVAGLALEGRKVCGVRLERKAGGLEEPLRADLVVDASGRGSQAGAWLEELGYPRAPESNIKIGVGYTTRIYRRRPEHMDGLLAALSFPQPPSEYRYGVMLATEGERWMVMLGGWLGHHAPADERGFLEFAKSLPTPEIYNVIRQAEPLSEFRSIKYPANQRRHFERLNRFPEGFLVFGDAMCSFNPVYGQGMTVAALEAQALDRSLQQGTQGVWQRFFKRAAAIIEVPWMLAVGEDLRYPEIEAKRTLMGQFINAYVARVHRAVQVDQVVCLAFHKVAQLLKPPTSLFAPQIVARVIRANVGRSKLQASVQSLDAGD